MIDGFSLCVCDMNFLTFKGKQEVRGRKSETYWLV